MEEMVAELNRMNHVADDSTSEIVKAEILKVVEEAHCRMNRFKAIKN